MTEPKAKNEAPGGGRQSDCCPVDNGASFFAFDSVILVYANISGL